MNGGSEERDIGRQTASLKQADFLISVPHLTDIQQLARLFDYSKLPVRQFARRFFFWFNGGLKVELRLESGSIR
jgi:hypothetical protein